MHALSQLANSTYNSSIFYQHAMLIIAILIISYLIGSINSAIILCKACGYPSPLTKGSKNPGATNVMRIAGKKLAAVTLLCDALKGFVPVIICHFIFKSPDITPDLTPDLTLALVAFFAILGHIFPVFFKFKGGKGVATFLGALIAINFLVAFLTILTWIIIAKVIRISSLSAIIACVLCPFYTWFFVSGQLALAITGICIIIILKHHENIRKLLSGEESIFKNKK